MKIRTAIKGYLLDGRMNSQAPEHVTNKKQKLERFASLCESLEVFEVEEIATLHIRAFVEMLYEAKTDDLDKRRAKVSKPLMVTSVKAYVIVIKAFLNWCKKEDLIKINPVDSLPLIKVPKRVIQAFKPDQVFSMLEECDTSTTLGARDYAVLLLLLDSGIRVSELCSLMLHSVHDDYLTVFGKGSKEREVGIGPTTGKAIWKYIHQFRRPTNPREERVFLSRTGKPISRRVVNQLMLRLGAEADLQSVRNSPHTLRHTFAKLFLKNSKDVYKLSRLLGHSSVQVTETYLRDVENSDAHENYQAFSPVETTNVRKAKSKRDSKRKKASP